MTSGCDFVAFSIHFYLFLSYPYDSKLILRQPFDIDFKNIWKYDTEELCDYILQYERYVADLRKKYGGN